MRVWLRIPTMHPATGSVEFINLNFDGIEMLLKKGFFVFYFFVMAGPKGSYVYSAPSDISPDISSLKNYSKMYE